MQKHKQLVDLLGNEIYRTAANFVGNRMRYSQFTGSFYANRIEFIDNLEIRHIQEAISEQIINSI